MNIRKSLFTILVALGFGIAAALFAHRWINTRVAAIEAEKRDGVPVVVAARDIPFGERITQDQVTTLSWPREHVPDDVYHDTTEVIGKVTNQKVMRGEIVLRQRASNAAGGNSLSSLIEPNKRALSVRVNDVIGVAGFLAPGNRVDVLATHMNNRGAAQVAETHTLLQNVKVLAVDQSAKTEDDKPVVVRAVTLEVDPVQAESLVKATEEGTVQLVLRNPDDTALVALAPQPVEPTPAPAAPATKPATRPPSTRVSRRAAAPSPAPPPVPSVTVIRQAQVATSPVMP